MWIGTSLGKCLKSILDGKVKEEDVLVIVTNTMCPNLERLMDVIDHYYFSPPSRAYDMSAHSFGDAKAVAQRLYEHGQLHQPRCFTDVHRAHLLNDTWYEIAPSPSTHNQSVMDAYGQYRMLADLAK
jgi:hypothetical protein